MIKHIVFWKFEENTEKEQAEFFAALESLRGKIDVLKSLEVHKNVNPDNDCDAALITVFENPDDLAAYKKHPLHVAASSLCKNIRLSRHAVDFEF